MTDDLREKIRRLNVEVDRLRDSNSRLTHSLGTLEQGIATAPDVGWREHLQSAIQRARSFGPPETTSDFPATVDRIVAAADRQRKLAEAARPAVSTVAASDEELVSDPQLAILESGGWPAPAAGHTVLWLFRAGRGPVYASRQKPEPQVLAGVLAWTVDGQHCPVSLPLRDWVEPGQRMALVALPIGGDA